MPDFQFLRRHMSLVRTLGAVVLGLAVGAAAQGGVADGVASAGPQRVKHEGAPFLDTELNRVLREWRAGSARGGNAVPLTDAIHAETRIKVSFVFGDERSAAAAVAPLVALGAEVTARYRRLVDALVPVANLGELGTIPGLMVAHRAFPAFPSQAPATAYAVTGTAVSAGVAAAGADTWHTAGADGTGTTVGVIGSFAGYGAAVAAGEVPEAFATGPLDVSAALGTACVEVVHDMAPGAEIVLSSAATTTEAAASIAALAALGATVITSPAQYMTPDAPPLSGPGREPGDGSSALCQAIADARSLSGTLFVQAAGDLAKSHWDGTFLDSNRNLYHEFAPGVEINEITLGTASIATFLRWDDWPASSQDYDLELWVKNEGAIWELVTSSQIEQSGTQPPWEYIQFALDPGSQYGLRIKKYGATRNVFLDLTDYSRAILSQTVAERSLVDAAACAEAFVAATVDAQDAAFAVTESSSQGPTYGPGGVAAGGIDQPRIAAYANVDTFTYGAGAFTSSAAAAAHAAGAAALVWQQQPLFTPDQVQTFLEARAVEVDGTALGYDHEVGAGRLFLGVAGPCTYELTPSTVDAPIEGAEGSFEIAAAPGCPWEAVSEAEWLVVTSAVSGTGNGAVSYRIEANSGGARAAAITVGASSFTASQAAASCAYELSASGAAMTSDGGQESVDVSTNIAFCPWTAVANDEWIFVIGGASGDGAGTVTFTVAANDAEARTGTLTIAGHVYTVEQSAAACTIGLDAPGAVVPAAGGEGSVGVTSNLVSCEWTAVANDAWITVTAGASGTGAGSVTFTVAGNGGEARTGTLTIGGQAFTVEQGAPPCAFQLSAGSLSLPAAGGETDVDVISNLASCAWTATADAAWIVVASGASGTGSGTVHLVVPANAGEARSGAATIAGISFTVNQEAAPCAFELSAAGAHLPAAGGTGSVNVISNRPSCAWTAVTGAAWISVTSGAAGAGNGTTTFTVAANTGDVRLGTIVIAEHTFTIEQDPVPCAYSLSSPSASFAAAGGDGSVGVTANIQGCGWSAVANAGWITVTGGAAGTGNGTVSYTVAVNPGAARTGTLTVAGTTFTVLQGAAGCTYSLYSWSSSWGVVGVIGGQTRVYTNQPSCTWNSISNVPWVTITSGQAGTGNEYVTFDVAANPGLAREGTLTIAGRVYTVRQDGSPCSYSLSAAGTEIGATGGSGSVDVIASLPACPWTAVSSAPEWLVVTAGTAGTGNGTVSFTVLANAGDIRSATLTIAGHVFTVQQASPPCTYGIAPGSAPWAALGGNGSVAVTTAFASCTWTAVSNVPWLTITAGATGIGAGSVAYTVADNPGDPRVGTLTIAGYEFTVSQDKHGVAVRRNVPRRPGAS